MVEDREEPALEASSGRLRPAFCFAALFAYLAVTVIALRPPWKDLGAKIAPDPGDPLFNLVVLKWGVYSISRDLFHDFSHFWATFWNAPFFFPAPHVTTLSDHLLGPAALATLLERFGVDAIGAYNLLFLGSFAASGGSAYWVFRRSGRSEAAAFFGGLAFAFAPFRWDQASHLQMLLTAWLPLVLWHFDRLLVEGTFRRAVWFLFFYTLHVTGGAYLAYMIHIPLIALFVNRVAGPARIPWNAERARALALSGALALAVAATVFGPYVSARRSIERRGMEARLYGASVVSLFTPAVKNRYSDLFPPLWRRPENAFFPGFLPGTFAIAAIAAEARKRKRAAQVEPKPETWFTRWMPRLLAAIAGIAFAISEVRTWLEAPQVKTSGFFVTTLPYLTALLLLLLALGGALAIGARGAGTRRAWFADSGWQRGLFFAGAASALFAFPIAYVPLMKILPGFSGMRVESRFLVLASFSIAALAATGLDVALTWFRESSAFGRFRSSAASSRLAHLSIVAAVLGLAVFELSPKALPWGELPPLDPPPPVYGYLARSPSVAAVLELPIGAPLDDLPYLYFGSFHHKPMVNGYSGFVPPENQQFRADCCWPVPDAERLALLRSWGVSHVVVHVDRLERRWQRRLARHWERAAPVRKVFVHDGTIVYALDRATRPRNSPTGPSRRNRRVPPHDA